MKTLAKKSTANQRNKHNGEKVYIQWLTTLSIFIRLAVVASGVVPMAPGVSAPNIFKRWKNGLQTIRVRRFEKYHVTVPFEWCYGQGVFANFYLPERSSCLSLSLFLFPPPSLSHPHSSLPLLLFPLPLPPLLSPPTPSHTPSITNLPSLSLPSLRSRPLIRGLRKRSPSGNRIWCNLALKPDIL